MELNQTTFEDFDTGEANPLAGLNFDELVEVPAIVATADSIEATKSNQAETLPTKRANKRHKTEPLYLDFETIPDHSREDLFGLDPLPPETPESELLTAEEFLSQDLKTINDWLERKSPPAKWIEAIRNHEKASKKPRKGLFDALNLKQSELSDRIKAMSTNPMFCRICSAAWANGGEKPLSTYAGDDSMMERHLVELIWEQIARATHVVGYGVVFFDVPVLLARSMILGVHPARILDRRKYGSSDIVDLGELLFNYSIPKGMGLGRVCKALGIQSALPEVDGSHVYEMFKRGNVKGITDYNEDDVMLTQKLHREKMSGYFCV